MEAQLTVEHLLSPGLNVTVCPAASVSSAEEFVCIAQHGSALAV